MDRFEADVHGGGSAVAKTLLVGALATAALLGLAHLLALLSGVLGGIAVVGAIGTQIMVMVSMRKRPATLSLEGGRLVLRAGERELAAGDTSSPPTFGRYVLPQVGVMGQVLVLGPLTIGVMRSGGAGAVGPDVKKPSCLVNAETFDRLAARLSVPTAQRAAVAMAPTRFQIFANKSSARGVIKVMAYMWLVIAPATGVTAYLTEGLVSPLPAVISLAVFALTAGVGIALLLRKRERTIQITNGTLHVIDGDRTIQSVPLGSLAVRRVQHDVKAKTLRYKLTGIALRFPDGSEVAFASRVPGTWPAGVDEVRSGEPGWLMGPAELPAFARQVGIADSPHEGW